MKGERASIEGLWREKKRKDGQLMWPERARGSLTPLDDAQHEIEATEERRKVRGVLATVERPDAVAIERRKPGGIKGKRQGPRRIIGGGKPPLSSTERRRRKKARMAGLGHG